MKLTQIRNATVLLEYAGIRFLKSNIGKEDVLALHRAAPSALIVATHMEDLNHRTLSRQELRDFARKKGVLSKLRTPANGETLSLSAKPSGK